MPIQLGEIKVWGLLLGSGQRLYGALRLNESKIMFDIGGYKHRIELSQKADEHTALVVFDGFLMRHGLAGGTKVLSYEYGYNDLVASLRGKNDTYHPGPRHIEMETDPSNVKAVSDYESDRSKKDWDYVVSSSTSRPKQQTYAARGKSERYFLAVPKGTEGSRSLVCQLKPRSLERRYIMIVASYEEVKFMTCNSY